jgi:tRNA(Ile)-lysidine synthase
VSGDTNPCQAGVDALLMRLTGWVKEQGADPSAHLGVAFSGGADSTALLLAAARRWPGRITALHVNHGMQNAAADFEQHCRLFCAQHGIPLTVAQLQVLPQRGESPEDAARKARYAAIVAMCADAAVQNVALAQHADDQVETLLLALSRGAGLPGLAAMPAQFERGGVVFHRPILAVSGVALRQWLAQAQIAHITDPSNADESYTRNKIRHQLLPVLERAFPAFRQTMARSASHAAQAQVLLSQLAADDARQTGLPPSIPLLQALSTERQANLLRHWLYREHHCAPSATQLNELLKQIAACTTRGHRIQLKVAGGRVERAGWALVYSENPPSV